MKRIITKDEAIKSFLKGKEVLFGVDVENAWFDTSGFGKNFQDEVGFKTIVSSFYNWEIPKNIQYAVES
jgi:hypothetical protein